MRKILLALAVVLIGAFLGGTAASIYVHATETPHTAAAEDAHLNEVEKQLAALISDENNKLAEIQAQLTTQKAEIKSALDELIRRGEIGDALSADIDEIQGKLTAYDDGIAEANAQIEAFAVRLSEVQNDDGEVRIGPGFTEAVTAANRELAGRVGSLEEQWADFVKEGGTFHDHAGALEKAGEEKGSLKELADNFAWSEKKRAIDRHCLIKHADQPFGQCIIDHPAETADVTHSD